jgi:glycerol-3-phosphate acyltransferase PlsY
MTYALVFLTAYLIGSIPFGLILTKLAGLGDIRQIGSGNIGATNVLRTGNKKLAALTLLLDGMKGWVAVLLAMHMGGPIILEANTYTDCLPGPCYDETDVLFFSAWAGLVALVGHIFPVWLKFKGGKGVATYIGACFGLAPLLGLAACAAWLATALLFRISSLSALVMLAIVPVLALLSKPVFVLPLALISLLVIWRHKDNIKRLLNGTEPRIGKKA